MARAVAKVPPPPALPQCDACKILNVPIHTEVIDQVWVNLCNDFRTCNRRVDNQPNG